MGLIGIILHVIAVYIGAHIAEFESVDIWRSLVIAIVSYIAMFIVALLLFPLILVPVVNIFLGSIVLGAGTAIAAKIVLSCDWKPAWTVGITAAVINLLAVWLLSGCS